MIGIYKITCNETGKCYIGQSINIENRWKQHLYESFNRQDDTKFHNAIRKYGKENFELEVLEECELNQEILDERERYWIEYYDSYEKGYNSTRGGQQGSCWRYNPEEIQKLWNDGLTTEEIADSLQCSSSLVRRRLHGYGDYNSSTGHSRSFAKGVLEGRFDKLLEWINSNPTFISREVHQYDIDGNYIASYASLNDALRGINKHYPGAEGNIIRALDKSNNQKLAFGYQWSDIKVEKMDAVPLANSKLIRCIETGQVFHSASEASAWCRLKSNSNIRECCLKKRKTAGKHPVTGEKLRWEYVENMP